MVNGKPKHCYPARGAYRYDGAADANLRLSQARVESVKNYLLDKGVKKNRVFTKAFGETQPISTERTDEARALNRRVEVRVIRR